MPAGADLQRNHQKRKMGRLAHFHIF